MSEDGLSDLTRLNESSSTDKKLKPTLNLKGHLNHGHESC